MTGVAGAVEMKLDELLVDPSRFSVRQPYIDDGHVAQMVEDLAGGRALPPLRVAQAADPRAEWHSCPEHWKMTRRAQWAEETRRIASWANRPIMPGAVLIDGFHRYAALREAGHKTALVVIDDAPLTGVVDAVTRAAAANLRNGRSLSDRDVRVAFEIAWLGRPAKASHERWNPEPGALTLTDIAAQFGKTPSWCVDMQQVCRIRYRLGDLELPRAKCRLLDKLPEDEWAPFVYMQHDGGLALRPHPLFDDGLVPLPLAGRKTVVEMTTAELRNVVEARVRAIAMPDAPPPPPPPIDSGPDEGDPELDGEQYILDYEPPDWQAELGTYTRIYDVAKRLPPPVARDQALAMLPSLRLAQRTYEALCQQAKRGGLEV